MNDNVKEMSGHDPKPIRNISTRAKLPKIGYPYTLQPNYNPNFIGSAGAHMRHIIDHYQSIMVGITQHFIDYNHRSTGANIEHAPFLADPKIADVKQH